VEIASEVHRLDESFEKNEISNANDIEMTFLNPGKSVNNFGFS